ncbi:GEVED domain-containing protein [Brumimicrobium oceani]|uniref:Uncharacterized protein n=1 Tax=Brumimicrobium oceani TaxID=2100725 RepID=A0A2U2XAP4_9FLAO|nr:GEVED domain-containing protein [Brumimicrobium oceani]PWH84827.1 hypothetical protein DIT68_12945 [Brumimicrobium oceani]
MKRILKKIRDVGLALTMTASFATVASAQFGCGSGVVISDGYTASGITTPGNGGPEDWVNSVTGPSSTSYWNDDVYMFEYTAGATTEEITMTIDSRNSWNGIAIFTTCSGATLSGSLDDETSSGTGLRTVTAVISASQTVYIAVGQFGAPDDLDFDVTNFSVTTITCADPTALAVSNITASSVDLAWTENGTATTWNIEYGAPGFTVGNGTPGTAVGNPTTISGLTADTDYEFYVQADCGGGDLSGWSGPFSFFTGLCVPSPSSVDGIGITNVTMGTINNTTGAETNNYGDYTAQSTDVAAGTSLPIDITLETGYTYNLFAWVDWNGDLDYDDAGEGFYLGESTSANPTTFSASILIPVTANLGNYRLRIGGADNGLGSSLPSDPCYSSGYASFEDYTINVTAAPTCVDPSALMASNLTLTTADLAWTENGTATVWNIEYGAPGFTVGNGTPANSVGNPATVTGLTSDTEYEFYVQADCGGGDLSGWSGPYSFFTGYCQVATTSTGDYLTGVSSSGAQTDVSYTASSQPSGSYANETAQVFESYETQVFDINTTYQGGSNGVNIWVDWNNDLIFDASEIIGSGTGSTAYNISVTIPVGTPLGDYRMRVRAQYGSSANPPACGSVSFGSTVDFNLSILSAPACLNPSALSASNVTSTSADLAWTVNGIETVWNVEYDTVGFTLGNGVNAQATTNPFNVTGLASNTDYEFYVQADCGADSSAWTGPFSFTTLCATYTAPFVYDVEAAATTTSSVIEDCWSSTPNNTSSDYRWNVDGSGGTPSSTTGPDGANSGSNYFYVEASSGSDGDTAYLTTPTVDVSALTTPSLEFFYHMFGADVDTLAVEVSDDAGATWTNELYIIGEQQTASTDPWMLQIVDLSAYTGDIQVRFMAIRGASYFGDISLDDISIKELPTCIDPSALMVDNITLTSVDLSWMENGTATTWNIEYGAPGFTLGNGTPENGLTSNPYTLTGLTGFTNYEYYVQADCGGGDESAWVGPFAFYTGYCIPSASSASTYIDDFSTSNGSTNISNLTSGFTLGGYFDGSAQVVSSYETSSFDFSASIVGGTVGFAIWIDWNNDLVFDDATEKVFNTTSYGSGPFTGTVTIPAGTQLGDYRMRITTDYLSSNPSDPCADRSRAEFEDYTLTVVPAPPCADPSVLTASNITTTSADLAWTENGTATAWNIEYGPAGFTPGAGTILATTTNPHTLSGLMPCTNYEYYVEADCGVNSSTMVGPFAFTTQDTPATGTDTQVACETFTWIDGNTYTSSNNTATFTIVGGGSSICGNDSIVTLDLTINNATTGTDVQAACETFDWIDGNTYTASNNTATFTIVGGNANGCDSIVTLDLTIDTPPSAGDDVTRTFCLNQPLDLDTLLSANADAGGTWLDPTSAPLTGSSITVSDQAGVYVYTYVTAANGACPAATASVEITADDGCDYLSVDTEALVDISVYPNPTANVLTILNPSNTSSLKVEMLDMNGRVVLLENKALNNAMEATLEIEYLEKGIYTLRVYNSEASKTFKIVKQ